MVRMTVQPVLQEIGRRLRELASPSLRARRDLCSDRRRLSSRSRRHTERVRRLVVRLELGGLVLVLRLRGRRRRA